MKTPDDDRWSSLPSAALLTIFRRIDLDERLQTIPLVCKSWRSVSEHPQCWSSMIPDSVPPEKAFIKKCSTFLRKYYIKLDDQVAAKLTSTTELGGEGRLALGVSRLETLIKKSAGGDAITSLYLSPFLSHHYDRSSSTFVTNRDNVLGLIADCCPNLKHISFLNCERDLYESTEEKIVQQFEEKLIELINKCRRLELIDFDYALGIGCVQSSLTLLIQKLGSCLPYLRGIRIRTGAVYWGSSCTCPIAHAIANYLPRLKLLNLADSRVNDDELSIILSRCLELQYLNVMGSSVSRMFEIEASAKIPEFYISGGCPTCNEGESDIATESDIADMSVFDQEENGKQERKLISYSYDDQTFQTFYRGKLERKLISYSYDDQTFQTFYRSKLEYNSSAGCYEETDNLYDHQYYWLKDGRSNAFYRGQAKDRKRRRFKLLFGHLGKLDGRRSNFKPLVECKMPYADDLYVMPVCK